MTDIKTTIPCPTCKGLVFHRYRCKCNSYWGYCSNKEGCKYFYCPRCEEEQKVGWDDEVVTKEETPKIDFYPIQEGWFELPKSQEETLLKVFEVEGEGDKWSTEERQAIQEMLDEIQTPFEESDPLPKHLQEICDKELGLTTHELERQNAW